MKPYPKGVSGNPGGVPKYDVAAELAKAIIENNEELIYKAFVKALSKGNAYCFQVLADRGYGKLREVHAIEHSPYKHLSDEQLNAKIKELEAKLAADLGYVKVEPKILPPADDKDKVQ